MYDKISKKLAAIIQNNSKIQSVYNYEASEIDGTPCATLTPSGNESDYHSTTENSRVYAFVLRLYQVRGSGKVNEDTTEKAMREMVDTVLNNLDAAHRLTGLETQTGYTFLWLEAAPSRWGYVNGDVNYRVAEIAIRVHFSVDVNLIS